MIDNQYVRPEGAEPVHDLAPHSGYLSQDDLREIVELLPPGTYTRQRLCDQINSSITGHAWGQVYGTVE